MILRSSVRGTQCTAAEGVSLGRDSNRGPDRNRANSINVNLNNNNNYNNNNNNNNNNDSLEYIQYNNLGDGSAHSIFKCNSNRCLFQKKFITIDRFKSTTTGRIYDVVVPPGTIYLNDHTSNVIYLITCDRCRLQYVGETCQKLNERFNCHTSAMRNPSKLSYCEILNKHFTVGHCKGSTYSVCIIEKLDGTGQTDRGCMDTRFTAARKAQETYWMKELRTVYPYGLNDRVGDEPKTSNTHINVALRFKSLPRKNKRIGRGRSHNGTNTMTPSDFINKFKQYLNDDITSLPNFIRISLFSMKKSSLKTVHQLLSDMLSQDSSLSTFEQYFLQSFDIIESKLYKPKPLKSKRKPPENVCNIFFDNKGVEFINLARILRDPEIVSLIPDTPHKFSIPMVTYTLGIPISSKIFNFNKFVDSLDLDEFLSNPNSLPCECNNSPFADKHHKHIVTGDLRLISNSTLRKLLSKGPKYRESKPINLDKAKESILTGIDECVDNFCSKHGISKSYFTEWISNIKSKINKRIVVLKDTLHLYQHERSLDSPEVELALQSIHSKYVVVPIDKATGNISLVCKRFYASVIAKELGMGENNSTYTYSQVTNKTAEDIINSNIRDLKQKFGIDNISLDNHCLPNMYWLPKIHKTPIKARFIIASPKSSIKDLSKAITSVFRLFYKQIENYNDKCRFFTGVNTFWVVQNNKPVIDAMTKLNARNKARSISTFDFSTLYTKLPHDKLLDVLNKLIDFCFNGGNLKYIVVTKSGARWSKEHKDSVLCFDKGKMKEAVKYLLSNCFFRVGSKIFCQIIGIPMGSDPAPFFANLFLYFYESKWMDSLKKKDLIRARKFCNMFRFIDDLSAINDGGDFDNIYKDIYPAELELGKENINNNEASFLDLHIKIENNKFCVGLFDKRDNFPFSIVRMPYKSSNLPSNIFYSAIGAEALRIARASNNVDAFSSSIKPLITRMIKQGAQHHRLSKVLCKFYKRHQPYFKDIVNNSQELLSLFFR